MKRKNRCIEFFMNLRNNEQIQNLSNEFKCAHCGVVMIEPYLLSCSHVFCTDCKNLLFFQEMKICMICKEEIENVMLDKRMIKNLQKIEISCFNSNQCIWKGNLLEFENHGNECLYEYIECDLYCQEKVEKKDMINHKLNLCIEREVICEYCKISQKSKDYTNHLDRICNEIPIICPNECTTNESITKIKKKDLEKHLKDCQYQNISCEICNESIRRNEINNHVFTNIYSHFIGLKNEIIILKEQNEIQNFNISKNEFEISELKNLVRILQVQLDLKEEQIPKINEKSNHNKIQKSKRNNKDSKNQNYLQENYILEHGSNVFSLLKFSDNLLISGGDKDIKYWNLNNYNLIDTIQYAHTHYIRKIIKLNEENFASASSDSKIKIWDAESKKPLKVLEEHTNYVYDILLLSNKTIASASGDKLIKIWDINSDISINTFAGHSSYVNCLIEIKENTIISGGNDETIRFWDLKFSKNKKILHAHSYAVLSLVKINDFQFASGSNREIKVWEYPTGNCLKSLRGHTLWINHMILFDDTIVSASSDKNIKQWNIITGENISTLSAHTSFVSRLEKINETDLVSGSYDGNIIIWKNWRIHK